MCCQLKWVHGSALYKSVDVIDLEYVSPVGLLSDVNTTPSVGSDKLKLKSEVTSSLINKETRALL